jgi:hypothetical protein
MMRTLCRTFTTEEVNAVQAGLRDAVVAMGGELR